MLRHLSYWLRKGDIHDAANELQAPPRDIEMLKNGAYTLLYAMLLEEEDILHGNDAYEAWALAAWHVFNTCYHNAKSERIRPHVLRDREMHTWMQKAIKSARSPYGETNLQAEAGLVCVRDHVRSHDVCGADDGMHSVGRDGLDGGGHYMYLSTRNYNIFSTCPPGSDKQPPAMARCPTM